MHTESITTLPLSHTSRYISQEYGSLCSGIAIAMLVTAVYIMCRKFVQENLRNTIMALLKLMWSTMDRWEVKNMHSIATSCVIIVISSWIQYICYYCQHCDILWGPRLDSQSHWCRVVITTNKTTCISQNNWLLWSLGLCVVHWYSSDGVPRPHQTDQNTFVIVTKN